MLMKRTVFALCILFIALPAVLFSQENEPVLYLEMGAFLNIGGGSIKMNDDSGSGFMMKFGEFKIGYGPIFNLPLYVAGEITASWENGAPVNSRNSASGFTSMPLYTGVGVLFYPIPIIQLGGSLGVSWSLRADLPSAVTTSRVSDDDFAPGFGWNIYAAADLGNVMNKWKNVDQESLMGLLLGLQVSGSRHNFTSYYLRDEIASGTVSTAFVSGFLKWYWKFPR